MITQPNIIPIAGDEIDTYLYKNIGDYYYYFTLDDIAYKGLVRDGFIFDGCSIPLIGTVVLDVQRDGLERAAAMPHDDLYDKNGRIEVSQYDNKGGWIPSIRIFSRKESDMIFKSILYSVGNLSSKRIEVMYSGLRLGGWIAWNGHKNKVTIDNTELHTDLTDKEMSHHLKVIHDYNLRNK